MVSENPRTAYEQKEMALGETGVGRGAERRGVEGGGGIEGEGWERGRGSEGGYRGVGEPQDGL